MSLAKAPLQTTCKAWAIARRWLTDSNAIPGRWFYGKYYFLDHPAHYSGYITATFATRKSAYAAIPKNHSSSVSYRVVRVVITVTKTP